MNTATSLRFWILVVALNCGSLHSANGSPALSSPLLDQAFVQFGGVLLAAEARMILYAGMGAQSDYSDQDQHNNDPAEAHLWDESRVLRSQVVAWLCTDSTAASLVTRQGIRIKGARIDGPLDLAWSHILFPLTFAHCAFTGELNVTRSNMRHLGLTGSRVTALKGSGLQIEGSLHLDQGFVAEGQVNLLNARIGGALECDESAFLGKGGFSLLADRAFIANGLMFSRAFAANGVSVFNASIGSHVLFQNTTLAGEDRSALAAYGLVIQGPLRFGDGFKATHLINLTSSRIRGDLIVERAQFTHKSNVAITLDRATVERGVMVNNARVEGAFSLQSATIGMDMVFKETQFLNDSFMALLGPSMMVGGNVSIGDTVIEGGADFMVAVMQGDLRFGNARIRHSDEVAFKADSIRIRGGLYIVESHVEGGVQLVGARVDGDVHSKDTHLSHLRLTGATIEGAFVMDDTTLSNTNGVALHADSIVVKGPVLLRQGFTTFGTVRLRGAELGALECDGGRFFGALIVGRDEAPGDGLRGSYPLALSLDGATIKGPLFLRRGFESQGIVSLVGARVHRGIQVFDVRNPDQMILDLRDAWTSSFQDSAKSWPAVGNLYLDGFVYERLHHFAPIDARARSEWIRRQPSRSYGEQPYRQLASALQNAGHETEAVDILIEKNRRLAGRSPSYVLSNLLLEIVGYGYRPENAFWASLLVIGVGWGVFRWAYHNKVLTESDPTKSGCGPMFCAFIYSVETFVPLVKLGISDYWRPDTKAVHRIPVRKCFSLPAGRLCRYYLWLHIALGWLLTSLWVAALTGLVKS